MDAALSSESRDLDRLFEKCRAARFGFTQAEFSGIVRDVMSRSLPDGCGARERTRFRESLRLDELVLARACARGQEEAWKEFLTLYREKLYRAATVITREESMGRELADSVYADLFGVRVREDGRRVSKLESYLGRGSLEGWLRTVLAQEYVNRRRAERKLVRFEEALEAAEPASLHGVAKQEHTQAARAIDKALTELSYEERTLLAAYYLDGRTLAEMGRMLRLHESTVSRRLEKITAGLRKKILRLLREAGVEKGAAEQMLELDVRDLGVDVRGRLAQGR